MLEYKPEKIQKRYKLSEMLYDVAYEYINLGDDIEEKQQFLYGAISGWNMACSDINKRKKELSKYMAQYKRMNPTQSEQDYKDVEENMKLLIKQKLKLYPKEKTQIVGGEIKEVDGKTHLNVVSIRTT